MTYIQDTCSPLTKKSYLFGVRAAYAQSPADFINKLSIALKECDETLYWLNILKDTEFINEKEFDSMNTDCREVLALLISSIKTTKQNNETN